MAKPNITEVGRVTVPSADQDRSLAFYTETLGFEKRVDETFADGRMRWIEVAPAGGTTAIALTPPMGEFQPGRQTGIIVSTDDIEAAHAALKDPGPAGRGGTSEAHGRGAMVRPPGIVGEMRNRSPT